MRIRTSTPEQSNPETRAWRAYDALDAAIWNGLYTYRIGPRGSSIFRPRRGIRGLDDRSDGSGRTDTIVTGPDHSLLVQHGRDTVVLRTRAASKDTYAAYACQGPSDRTRRQLSGYILGEHPSLVIPDAARMPAQELKDRLWQTIQKTGEFAPLWEGSQDTGRGTEMANDLTLEIKGFTGNRTPGGKLLAFLEWASDLRMPGIHTQTS